MTRFAVLTVVGWMAAWFVVSPVPSVLAQTSGEYAIGIGDELEITVWQREDLGATLIVDPEGNITLPLIGGIRATGQTPARLGEELTRRFSFVDREVSQVTVAVLNYNSRRVFVMGEVLEPGAYSFPQIPGVWEVIREAGGPTADAALSRVRVIPPDGAGSPRIVNLDQVLVTGDFSLLPPLQPGSTVLVPRQEVAGPEGDVVYVWGSVVVPGPISITAAPNLIQAILAAGGPADDANIKHVRVVRPGPVRARVFEVDMRDYTEKGKLFTNIDLQPGDTVTVPRANAPRYARFLRDVVAVTAGTLGTILLWRELTREDQ